MVKPLERVFEVPTPFEIGRVNCYVFEDDELTLFDPGSATEMFPGILEVIGYLDPLEDEGRSPIVGRREAIRFPVSLPVSERAIGPIRRRTGSTSLFTSRSSVSRVCQSSTPASRSVPISLVS